MPVRIVTDSTSDLSPEDASAHNITVVPLSVQFGSQTYIDGMHPTDAAGEPIATTQFYEKMSATKDLPQTAAPAPGAFAQAFQAAADDGADAVVCVNISFALSATGQSARTAAQGLADKVDVRVVDSQKVSLGLGVMVLAAAQAAADGKTADEIVALMEDMRERTRVYAVLDTLENLRKGGRIGTAQALLGTALAIKPCVDISSGEVVAVGRQRTRGKALAWLVSKAAEEAPLESVAVVHAAADDTDRFVQMLEQELGVQQVRTGMVGPVVGTHAGAGVMGVVLVRAAS